LSFTKDINVAHVLHATYNIIGQGKNLMNEPTWIEFTDIHKNVIVIRAEEISHFHSSATLTYFVYTRGIATPLTEISINVADNLWKVLKAGQAYPDLRKDSKLIYKAEIRGTHHTEPNSLVAYFSTYEKAEQALDKALEEGIKYLHPSFDPKNTPGTYDIAFQNQMKRKIITIIAVLD